MIFSFFRLNRLAYGFITKSMAVLVISCFVSYSVHAESNTYINYQFEQGFKASNGYCLFQDTKGYIWIGSENGLMRFNGYEFKTYTTRDGLPDNEILSITEDRDGRLWLSPFTNAICYIKNGKVYNQDNDTILKSLRFGFSPNTILIDCYNTVWIYNKDKLTGLTADNKLTSFTRFAKGDYLAWLNNEKKLMVVDAEGRVFQWDKDKFINKGKAPAVPNQFARFTNSLFLNFKEQKLYRYTTGPDEALFSKAIRIPSIVDVHDVKQLSPTELYVTSDNGVYIIDINSGIIKEHLLKGYKVGSILRARDQSLWLGTTGKGIFRISKTPVKSIEFPGLPPSVLFLKGTKEGMYGTTDDARLMEVSLRDNKLSGQVKFSYLDRNNPFNRYVYVFPYGQNKWLACANYLILNATKEPTHPFKTGWISKSVIREDLNKLLIASIHGVIRYDVSTLQSVDTFLFKQRVMVVAKVNHTIYAGTLDGLIAIIDKHRSYPVLHDIPAMRKHITALCAGKNNMLWCAYNTELAGLRNDSLITLINIKNGLQCNRISCIQATGNFVWVGTDNGLYAIKQYPPYNIVRHITFASGLNSNQVNTLDVHENKIWVGTLKGVNYFDEGDIFLERDSTKIIINSILNADSLFTSSKDRIVLRDKPLTIDFDVIDFSGGTKTFFEYRIDDGAWIFLESKSLYFSTLPYGQFTLSIRAFSPNWIGGATVVQAFYNPLPFYRTWWFIASVSVAVIALLILSVCAFISKERKKDKKRLGIQKNLLLLEQTALQGQMNPHFIFNCIAAIKQYYNSGDITRANNFVHAFSSLIRQTFEMGTETFLSLDKELNYLVQYLSVEKERFKDSFNYQINKQVLLPDNKINVPALLLQPIVENAIRHGVRHLPKDKGMIQISVLQKESMVEFIITDNGIGRKKSKILRERDFNENMTSTTVNEKRIHILNQLFDGKIIMHTEDLVRDNGEGGGTKVSISFPVDLKQFLKDESNNSGR
jgi:anti-sigma regulatory factor (Ser/Thr protein kinase)